MVNSDLIRLLKTTTIPLLIIISINAANIFHSILSSDFRQDEFISEEYFGFWLALTVLPSKQFARDYRIREGFMLVHEEEKCFSLHIKHFLLCRNDKDIPTLKTMTTYFYCFCLSLESVRIVKLCEVHKRLKTTVVFETSFLLPKQKGYPSFHGDVFQWACFCNGNRPLIAINNTTETRILFTWHRTSK